MKKVNLTNVEEATDRKSLPAGGYICKFTKVEDNEDRNFLYLEFDIAKGEFEGYYQGLSDSRGFWGGKCWRSYTEKALPLFKRFCSCVNKSNNGFIFDGDTNTDEQTLVGKLIGLVLCEEEYIGNDGNLKTRLYVDREYSVEDIISGNFKVKDLKKLPEEQTSNEEPKPADTSFMDVQEGKRTDLPF